MGDRTQSGEMDPTWTTDEHAKSAVVTSFDLPVVAGDRVEDPTTVDFPSVNLNFGFSHMKTSHTSDSNSPSPSSSTTSLPNFLRVPSWEAAVSATRESTSSTSAATSVTAKTKPENVTVKTEDDIKVYVETTMNELLGWYGLPKMDNTDTPQLTIPDYSASSSQRSPTRPTSAASTPTAANSSAAAATNKKRCGRKDRESCLDNKLPSDTNNNSSSCGADDEDDGDDCRDVVDARDDDAMDSVHDSFDGGSDVNGLISPGPGGGEVPDSERGVAIICSWCQRNGNKLFTLETSNGVRSFCSELCFNQCRRASFKRNKVCEWCKHVRHTLNFVDFQDGDIQLQFCSEKCLNQYKMNIFCTEARQHLQHIQGMTGEEVKKTLGKGKGHNQEKEILITPDLWLSAHSNSKVAIKQEITEEELDKTADSQKGDTQTSKILHNGIEPGEVLESEARWAIGAEASVRSALSDHSSSNDDKVVKKMMSSSIPRQKKDRSTSRHTASKSDDRNGSESSNSDRDRIRKLLSGTSIGSPELSPSTSSVKERVDSHPGLSPQKNISFPCSIGGATFNPHQMNGLPLLPSWATSQLLTMMPSHLNPSLAAANINSSLGGLGYVSNPLLYSSLFGSTSLAMAAQKEIASSNLAKFVQEARQESLRDRSLEAKRRNIRGESTERSTRSTSSSYSSPDTPGPPSTPDIAMSSVSDPAASFLPGFTRQIPHSLQTSDLSQSLPLPHYLTDPAVAGMFPVTYGLSHTQQSGAPAASVMRPTAPPTHPAPAVAAAQTQQLPLPPVTILVPYPVAVPIPVPIPIPIPIAPEKFFAFFKEKSAQAKATTATTSTQQWPTDHRSASSTEVRARANSVSHIMNSSPLVSPQSSSKSLPLGRHPYGSSLSTLSSTDPILVLPSGRESADSIMTLRREIGGSQQKGASLSPCTSSGLKATTMSFSHFTLDRSKKTRLDYPPLCSEDEAIDLSKMSSRSSSPRGNCSEKDNSIQAQQVSLSDNDLDSSSQTSSITVPRIHIISEQPKPPLSQPTGGITIPSPPQQSSYSGRRSRILDAPSIPKRLRSPSPEQRYIRAVPRDMVEAARRRGLRARVRTK